MGGRHGGWRLPDCGLEVPEVPLVASLEGVLLVGIPDLPSRQRIPLGPAAGACRKIGRK